MVESVDCIVVGARVAGASLALRLARAGRRVIVLEAGDLFTDQPFSTHLMQRDGIAQLAEFGVLEEILETTPYVNHVALRMNGREASVPLTPSQRGLCPKRAHLDPALQRAAIAAGADLRPGARVRELIRDNERVVGVRYETTHGMAELRAPIVVGADGRRSTVARLVGAEAYLQQAGLRAGHFGYFEKPSGYGGEQWPSKAQIGYHGEEHQIVCDTSDGHVMIAIGGSHAEVRQGAGDPTAWMSARMRAWPAMAPFGEEPLRAVRKPLCMMKLQYHVRPAAGPGWALVGDAGVHEDPMSGLGINHALHDTRALAEALAMESEVALQMFWLDRDRAIVPDWRMSNMLGALDYADPFMEALIGDVSNSTRLQAAFAEGFTGDVPPQEILPPSSVAWCLVKQLARGRFAAVAGFRRALAVNTRIAADLKDIERKRADLLSKRPSLGPGARVIAALPA